MLMRISGGSEGIREYLETGRKADREFSRDELDTRVPLAGDLDFADRVIAGMQGDGEKYLHITLSFREDEISVETLEAVVADFREFAFAAYDDDEYTLYAEAHLPRRTSYVHAKTGELVERKPHIHIVVPETNLLTGRGLNPFGRVEQQTMFLEAFQEHVNAKYGLASPKDHRRTTFTPESELISRYKGDVFKGGGAELKAELLDAMLSRDVRTVEAFDALLAERGEVRTRNAGKSTEYRNVKPEGAAKGVNLKEYVFAREFIELPAAEKRARLSREAATHYATAGEARPTPADYAARLDDWRGRRAHEIKYLNSGNRTAYAAYRAADPEQQRAMLAERRAAFYRRYRAIEEPAQEAKHERPDRIQLGPERRPADRDPQFRRYLRQSYDLALTEPPEAKTLNGLRNLSGSSVAHGPGRYSELLPRHARDRVEQRGKESADGVRRAGNGHRADAGSAGVTPPLTDRQPNSVIERYAGQLREQQRERAAQRGQIDQIKRELDALRLLAQLSHTHGVIPEKYAVTQGKDGGDRIRCGTRNLNVTDFLTKELHLPWREAETILRDCFDRQQGREPAERKEAPRRRLWKQFDAERPKLREKREAAWTDQLADEKKRRAAVRTSYLAKRGRLQGDRALKPAERRAAISVARMERIAAEQALREVIKKEREALKAKFPAGEGQYTVWLQEQAAAGNPEALAELRRRERYAKAREVDQQPAPGPAAELRADTPATSVPFLPYRYEVSRAGDVTYSDHRGLLLRDARDRVSMLRTDENAVTVGLRLAAQKFYDPKAGELTELAVTGSAEFRRQAVEVAVRQGIKVRFTDREMEAYRQELVKQKQEELEAQKAKKQEHGERVKNVGPQREQKPAEQQSGKQPTTRRPRGIER